METCKSVFMVFIYYQKIGWHIYPRNCPVDPGVDDGVGSVDGVGPLTEEVLGERGLLTVLGGVTYSSKESAEVFVRNRTRGQPFPAGTTASIFLASLQGKKQNDDKQG